MLSILVYSVKGGVSFQFFTKYYLKFNCKNFRTQNLKIKYISERAKYQKNLLQIRKKSLKNWNETSPLHYIYYLWRFCFQSYRMIRFVSAVCACRNTWHPSLNGYFVRSRMDVNYRSLASKCLLYTYIYLKSSSIWKLFLK